MIAREKLKEKLFEAAEIARFTPEQVRSYEDSLKYYRDMKNSLDTAFEEGRMEGREEGERNTQIEIAKKLLALGMDTNTVSKITGLTLDEISRIEPEGNSD
jgi:predicted transposase/invertase (TIGR01784 family)